MTTILTVFLFFAFVSKLNLSHEAQMHAEFWFGKHETFFVEAVEQHKLDVERTSTRLARCIFATAKA